jgi:hypothetical protein
MSFSNSDVAIEASACYLEFPIQLIQLLGGFEKCFNALLLLNSSDEAKN